MAQLPSGFNADEIPDDEFTPVPAGWYPVEIVDSEWKDAKSGPKNKYIEMKLKILGENYNGRLLWVRLNLMNVNQTAVEIATKDLARISKACGLNAPEDTVELHGIPFEAKVVVREETADFPATNDVKGYRAIEGGAPKAASSLANGDGNKTKKPWEK